MRERIVLWFGIAVVALWTVYPIFWTVWASLMTERELIRGVFRWIENPSLDNYLGILGIKKLSDLFSGQAELVLRGFVNSAIVSLPTAVIGTVIATVAGYIFGRYAFPGKSAMLFALLTTRILPPVAILIPYFVFFSNIGLVGTPWGLIVTYLVSVIPLITWILMGYFASLPVEIERAARIDGCNRMQVFWYIMTPMALPGIIVAFIIAFLMAWNELLFAIILTGGGEWQTLSASILGLSPLMPSSPLLFALFAAASIMSAVPPLVLVFTFQRYITKLNVADPVTVMSEN